MATYALLDVDNTLINTEGTWLNEALLNSLQKKGIKDICLFTSMFANQIGLDIDKPTPYARENLIAELEKRGFVVHKVLTPLDVVLGEPGAYYEKHWKPAYDARKAGIIDPSLSQMDANLQDKYDPTHEKATEKGAMYELVLQDLGKIPNPSSGSKAPTSFVYFDDKQSDIDSVQKAHAETKHKVPLTIAPIQLRAGIYDDKVRAKAKAATPNYDNLSNKDKQDVLKKHTMPGDIPTNESEFASYPKRKHAIENRYTEQIAAHNNMLRKKPALKKTTVQHLTEEYRVSASSSEERTPSGSFSGASSTNSISEVLAELSASVEESKQETKAKSHQRPHKRDDIGSLKKMLKDGKVDLVQLNKLNKETGALLSEINTAIQSASISEKDKVHLTSWSEKISKNLNSLNAREDLSLVDIKVKREELSQIHTAVSGWIKDHQVPQYGQTVAKSITDSQPLAVREDPFSSRAASENLAVLEKMKSLANEYNRCVKEGEQLNKTAKSSLELAKALQRDGDDSMRYAKDTAVDSVKKIELFGIAKESMADATKQFAKAKEYAAKAKEKFDQAAQIREQMKDLGGNSKLSGTLKMDADAKVEVTPKKTM